MPYVALYRKYRSQTFDDVVGQDHVTRTIRNAIAAGRISHGYLFCGSRGTGKTTVARLVAKALNCLSSDGPTPDFCNKCEACVSISEGTAVDVIEMDAASNRSVDDMDALRDGVKYPPMQLRYKVYIIDEAHQLSSHAKDAFLKTLEEPPPHAVFILATTESHKIPITIRSRCQQFDFRRGTAAEIADRLRYVVESENATIEDEAVELISRSANGSYRDSLSVLEQVMAYTQGPVAAQDVYTVLGMVDEEVLLELGDVLASSDMSAAFEMADRLLREGRDVRELLRSAADHFRDLLALKVGADARHKEDERWLAQAERFSQGSLVHIIDVISSAEKELRWNEQHRLGLEMALLKAMEIQPEAATRPAAVPRPAPAPPKPEPAPKKQPTEGKKPREVERPEPAEPEAPREEPKKDVAEPADEASEPAPKEVTLSDVQRRWQEVLQHVHRVLKQPSVAAVAREGQPVALSDGVLQVGFTKKWDFHRQRMAQDVKWLQKGILAVLGAKLKVITVTTDTPDQDDAGGEEGPDGFEEREPAQHPALNDILTTFGGTVVEDDKSPWEE